MSKFQEPGYLNVENLSIRCSDVPDALLERDAAKNYFQQFGKILRIRLRPKQKVIIVEYVNEESAQIAYSESGEYDGTSFIVSRNKPKRDKKKHTKKLQDPNWSDDPDIRNELDAMKGTFSVNRSYALRPEAMVTEQIQNTPKKSVTRKKTIKQRQWKSEKISARPTYSESMAFLSQASEQEAELLKIIMTSAVTSDEKFRVLDARDKLVRLRIVRQSELARVSRTVGTCPDMCPEKERLMREVQHQVAAYEQLTGSAYKNAMNHSLAVKQYSRSSADQEAPLAHELRPVEVLQHTMGYLLHRIMDLCEIPDVNLAEWYHFVWDRTRGIRKDVTQQELCCEMSVQLVEQCARFHVHCAARLVAEDVSVFDDKINTENLTKCLQTLKYMYHDLTVKHNTMNCPNEAEFRAYIVLLNLNDGNFMWEVQQLSSDIQQSEEIRFALSVYSALDKNNYVRFFKLVKCTTYLNACILLRYFNQVRYRALLTIIKSYSPRSPCTQYPVEELYRSLAFEDRFNTIAFLEYYGLQLNEEKTHVLLDRNRFQQPDLPFGLERAVNVVESKRVISVGEVVCGESLPQKTFERHVPHNSFDDNGYLKLAELPTVFQRKYQQFLIQFGQSRLEQREYKRDVDEKYDVEMQQQYSEEKDEGIQTEDLKINKLFSNTILVENDSVTKLQVHKSTIGGFTFRLPTTTIPVSRDISATEPDGEIPSIFTGSFQNTNLIENNRTSESHLMSLASMKNVASKPFWATSNTSNTMSDTNKSIFLNTATTDKIHASSIFYNATKQKDEQKSDIQCSTTYYVPPVSQISFTAKNIANITAISSSPMPSTTFTIKPTKPLVNLQEKNVQIISTKPSYRNQEDDLFEKEQDIREDLIKKLNKEQDKVEATKVAAEKRLNELRKMEELRSKNELKKKKELELLEVKIELEVKLLMNDVLLKVEEDFVQNRLKQISENIKMRKILQFGRKWRNVTKISRKKRKNFFDNPVWVSSRSVSLEASALYTPNQTLTLHDIKRYKLGISSDIKIKEIKTIQKLDVHKLVWRMLFKQLCNSNNILNLNFYWKIGLSIPDSNEVNKGLSRLADMLQAALDWRQFDHGLMCLKRILPNNGGSVTYCLKKILQCENNLNGLLFVNMSTNITELNYNRLQKLIDDKQSTTMCFPLVILIKDDDSHRHAKYKNLIMQQLNVENLITSGVLSKCEIFTYNENNFEDALSSCLIFLAKNYVDYNSKLEMNELRTVLRNCIGEEFWYRIRSSSEINYRFSILLQEPNNVIDLYNKALYYCIDLLFDKSVYNLPSFPKEFRQFVKQEQILLPCTFEYFGEDWNKSSYLNKLKKIARSLRLPKFAYDWPPKSQNHLQEILQEYCSSVFAFEQNTNIRYKILSVILKNKHGTFETQVRFTSWIDIIELIALEKLNQILVNDSKQSIFTVVYNCEEMKDFRKVPWWFQLNHIQKGIKNVKYEEEFCDPEIIMDDTYNGDTDIDLDETLAEIYNKEENVESNKMKEFNQLSNLMEDLEKSMKIQKNIMAKFQETAMKALNTE